MSKHKIDQCSSCGADIIWIEDQNGTKLPVNKTRVRVYWCIGDDWAFEETDLEKGSAALVHISHFVTCPGASGHSKGGTGS